VVVAGGQAVGRCHRHRSSGARLSGAVAVSPGWRRCAVRHAIHRRTTVTLMLQPGDVAPAFSLSDQHGNTVSLGDFAGRRVMIFWYPKASTPG
jgi:hypothetical protein